MGSAADDVIRQLAGVYRAYPDTDGLLTTVIEAAMAPAQIVDDLTTSTDDVPAWQVLRDPDNTPAEFLDWLGQHVGERFHPSADEAEKRDRLKHPAGFDEGKTAVLKAEVVRTLTGTQAVRVLKFVDSTVWHMSVVTRTAETPDPAVTLAAAMRQKPAGVRLTHVVSDFALVADWTRAIEDTTEAIEDLELSDVT